MRGLVNIEWRGRAKRVVLASSLIMAMLVASLVSVSAVSETADARGLEYGGPVTEPTGPAYFGPAPNPFPYCDSPTYFDPFPENVDPIGRIDVNTDGSPNASVTTDGITMDLRITNEGNPDTRYPGFFPNGVDGVPRDQSKGVELAEGDAAEISLSQPLFYSQWIFTDVDQTDEGFSVTPKWREVGEAAAFAGDDFFDLSGPATGPLQLNDTNGVGSPSQAIAGRVQVDFLGAVDGIDVVRNSPSSGQSGFAVGGGCEATGTAKTVTAGPTWNGTAFEVTYELRLRNNLPSSATIQAVIDDAAAAIGDSYVTGSPAGIPLNNVRLTDDLTDPAFSSIDVNSVDVSAGLTKNDGYDGVTDFELLAAGSSIAAESDAVVTLSVTYTPDLSLQTWTQCPGTYDAYTNQSTIVGTASGVAVTDLSDDGTDPSPNADNNFGGSDDPTPVIFDCPMPTQLDIVKTVVSGPDGDCPTFDAGIVGLGDPLATAIGDTVTYCVSVRNIGTISAQNVVMSDAQRTGGDVVIGELAAGETHDEAYDVEVTATTPTTNTATANGSDIFGALAEVDDTAGIVTANAPNLEIVKTALVGPAAACPAFDDGVKELGPVVNFDEGGTVTYCITVRNTGDSAASNVEVADEQAPDGTDLVVGTLGVNDSETISYDLPVTATTPTTNIATARGKNPAGVDLTPVSDPAQIGLNAPGDPVLVIVKTVVAGPDGDCPTFDNGVVGDGTPLDVAYGEFVTYCVSVRNTGASAASDVRVDDEQAPAPILLGTIEAGKDTTESYDVQVNELTDELNTATVTGVGPSGIIPSDSDTAVINPSIGLRPALAIVKTVVLGPNGDCPSFDDGTAGRGDALMVDVGEVVTYCVAVRNTATGTASNVQVSDVQAGASSLEMGTLLAGETKSTSYDVEVLDSTPGVNVATATGTGPGGSPIDQVSDDAAIATNSEAPIIELIHSVAKEDDECLTAAKDRNSLTADIAGSAIKWCAKITNTGQVPLTNVVLSAPEIGVEGVNVLGSSAVLPAGESITLVVGGDMIPVGGLTSVGVVTADPSDPNGTPVAGADPVTDTDDAEVREANINLETTVVAGADGDCDDAVELITVEPGTDVTWCFEVTNTGTVDLSVEEVIDVTLGITISIDAAAQTLAPGEVIVVKTTTVATGDLTNDARVLGQPLDLDGEPLAQAPTVEDEDPAGIAIRAADLAIVKSVSNAGPVIAGTALTYTLDVTNNGPSTAIAVTITDSLPTGLEYITLPSNSDWTCSQATDGRSFGCAKLSNMLSGESVTLTYSVNVTAGSGATLVNVATVSSTTPDSDDTNNSDTASTQTPNATVVPAINQPEYPGPFTTPAVDTPDAQPAPPLALPDEVLGTTTLANTGSQSRLLGLISTLMLVLGGLMVVGARRSRRDA